MKQKKIKAKLQNVSEESKRLAYQEKMEEKARLIMMSVFGLYPDAETNLREYEPLNKDGNKKKFNHVYAVLAKVLGVPSHLRSDFDFCKTIKEMTALVAFKVWDMKKSKTIYLRK